MDGMPNIYVEGRDDQYSLIALLEANGISFNPDTRRVSFVTTESISSMLDNLCAFIKSAQNQRLPVGFVLDIDADINARWRAIRTRLASIGIIVREDEIKDVGVILDLPAAPIGFWLMPDNVSSIGNLENFLRTLIPNDNAVIEISSAYVTDVKASVATDNRFRDGDIGKAEMSAWLSVQDPPGLPYGTAIKAHILKPHSPVADKFVKWFRSLYSL